MPRTLLESTLPAAIALAIALALLLLVIRFSGARLQWRRLREMHSCQDGGVQSLAFVITLPLFVVIVQFIVQVSQLMIAAMVVQYAAFAAARAACVWIPAEVGENVPLVPESANRLHHSIHTPGTPQSRPLLLTFNRSQAQPEDSRTIVWEYDERSPDVRSARYAAIYQAAAVACVPLAPSRDLGRRNSNQNGKISEVLKGFYAGMVPASEGNRRLRDRIDNKVIYSFMNTSVRLEFIDKNSQTGPTYNPWPAAVMVLPNGTTQSRPWRADEIGWQDPITVTVTHNFVLLPGPGRFLAKHLVRADGKPDRISPQIDRAQTPSREPLDTTAVWATATMTNEGLKSAVPYVQDTR